MAQLVQRIIRAIESQVCARAEYSRFGNRVPAEPLIEALDLGNACAKLSTRPKVVRAE